MLSLVGRAIVAHSTIFDNHPHPSPTFPPPPPHPSSHVYIVRLLIDVLYRRVKRGGVKGGGGEDCPQTIARPTTDNTNLGLNKLYSNESVHNSWTGSLWSELIACKTEKQRPPNITWLPVIKFHGNASGCVARDWASGIYQIFRSANCCDVVESGLPAPFKRKERVLGCRLRFTGDFCWRDRSTNSSLASAG